MTFGEFRAQIAKMDGNDDARVVFACSPEDIADAVGFSAIYPSTQVKIRNGEEHVERVIVFQGADIDRIVRRR